MFLLGVMLAQQMPMMVEDLGVGEKVGVLSGPLLLLFIYKTPLAWILTGQL